MEEATAALHCAWNSGIYDLQTGNVQPKSHNQHSQSGRPTFADMCAFDVTVAMAMHTVKVKHPRFEYISTDVTEMLLVDLAH